MVRVAIAGGHGGVGRTILEVLGESSEHEALVLSRKSAGDGGRTIQVDYRSVDKLVAVLETHQIDTVICCFAVQGDSLAISQLNLIQAAIKSKVTRQFVPSGFAIPYPQDAVELLPQLADYFKAIETLRQSDLQWTVFLNGIFLDYFGPSTLKSYLKPNVFVIDMKNKIAGIPGDGEAPITFTYTFDLARYVVSMLDMEDWPEESRVIGDTVTWHEFVRLAEEICDCRFDIHYDSLEKLRGFEITELPGHQALYQHFPKKAFQWFMSIFELYTANGTSCITTQDSLNKLFPSIQPLTVRDMLSKYWSDD
ncbi:NAD(P)-binding protein [Aspergillus indologenus CBS 114.80]|uniref:NAD(P)-binding protein n=1 Tax=Aspergillus indologenus CBS 114.80 TaxID=1450541 RepID=A0A2V5IEH0_9EURO|nr:NAD(P)-binding protein [Aspergillus indologenus CBS 114.80]